MLQTSDQLPVAAEYTARMPITDTTSSPSLIPSVTPNRRVPLPRSVDGVLGAIVGALDGVVVVGATVGALGALVVVGAFVAQHQLGQPCASYCGFPSRSSARLPWSTDVPVGEVDDVADGFVPHSEQS